MTGFFRRIRLGSGQRKKRHKKPDCEPKNWFQWIVDNVKSISLTSFELQEVDKELSNEQVRTGVEKAKLEIERIEQDLAHGNLQADLTRSQADREKATAKRERAQASSIQAEQRREDRESQVAVLSSIVDIMQKVATIEDPDLRRICTEYIQNLGRTPDEVIYGLEQTLSMISDMGGKVSLRPIEDSVKETEASSTAQPAGQSGDD